MKSFTLVIVSDSQTIFSGEAHYCGVTTLSGSLGLEAFHEPFIGVLQENSRISFTDSGGEDSSLIMQSGVLLFQNNTCTIVGVVPAAKSVG